MTNLEPECLRPVPLINGHDLIGLGYQPGPFFKEVLVAIEDAQIEGLVADREEALRMVKGLFDEGV
mgnify:FL=1